MSSELISLEWPVHHPTAVGGIEIVRRDEHFVSAGLGSLEYPLHVLNCLVLGDARADRAPIRPLLAQHVVLRVDEHDCGVAVPDVHQLLLPMRVLDRTGVRGTE